VTISIFLREKLRVLYNKFPFAPWHLLIMPEAEQQHPQFLTQKLGSVPVYH